MTIAELLKNIPRDLHLDAEVLLAFVTKKTRSFIFAYPEYELTSYETELYHAYWQRRLKNEPLAYLVEQKEFWGLVLRVTSDTLIPRPETELLIEYVLRARHSEHGSILEVGTGSGAIACALGVERPQWDIVATDISTAALGVAAHNIANLKLSNVQLLQSDLFSNLGAEKFDVMVSNPPYIAPFDPHLKALIYEPQLALVARLQGYAMLHAICANAKAYLNPGGLLVLEHGFEQAIRLREYGTQQGLNWVETLTDLAGKPRMTVFKTSKGHCEP